jgi:hypothetical protein
LPDARSGVTLDRVRRLVAIAAVAAGALLVPSGALGGDTGTLKGVVFNTTCPGPCSYPPDPPRRYTGEGLTVRIRQLPDRQTVAKLHPSDGTFSVDLPAARYRVHAGVKGECWRGETKKRDVVAGEVARVRLHVYNACIV